MTRLGVGGQVVNTRFKVRRRAPLSLDNDFLDLVDERDDLH